MDPLRICLVSSELAPYAKTGGLADVAAGLARYLASVGHDVRLYMPLYPRVRNAVADLQPAREQQNATIAFGARRYPWSAQKMQLPAVGDGGRATVYLVDCPALFDRPDIYGNGDDEHLRFALLTRAAIEGCQRMGFAPDVFHCNDWHTALLPLYLKTVYGWDRLFARSKTLLTIHNIGYQGVFPIDTLPDLGLAEQRGHLPQQDRDAGVLNFLKAGCLFADALTTVSKTYAREIQTRELGMGLEHVLQQRQHDLFGIVNGVDYDDWDPRTDPLLFANYSADDLEGKARNKQSLLDGFNLGYDLRVPVLGIVSRLTGQKGFELLPEMLPVLLGKRDLRLVVLGSGESRHENYFQWLRDAHPTRVAVYRGYNNELAHRIEAGADMFLMPSRYEPCGLNQMYSLRYGTVPIVRRTGGLADTVTQFDATTGEGTGFLFDDFSADALYGAVTFALQVWDVPSAWARLVRNGMAQDFSWQRQGREYEQLYRRLAASSRQ